MLNYLLGTAFSAEALSRPARSACFLPICSFGWCSLWANECGPEKRSSTCRAQFSALKLCHGPPVRPFFLPVLSAASALLWLVLAVDKRVRPGKAREAKLLWLAAPSGPIACVLDSNATLGTRPRRSRLPAHSFGSCSLRRSECGLQARWTRSCSCWLRPGDR